MFFSCQNTIEKIKKMLHNNFDLVDKFLNIGQNKIAIIYLKTLIDDNLLATGILTPLNTCTTNAGINEIKTNILRLADITEEEKIEKVLDGILDGKLALIFENESKILLVDIKQIPTRSPTEPPTSAVIYGPRVGFVESAETNLAMIRKHLPSPDFVVENFQVGKYTKTKVLICYLDNVADKKTVQHICKKIQEINIDGIVDSNYILTYFQGKSTIFKRTGIAEKPDIITGKILEGRVAIIVDGSPIVLTLPFMIFEDIQNSNDYYTNSIYSSFLRIIRLLGLFVAVVLPGLYLALRLYHFKVLPLRFLITIINSTENLPFTPFVEMLFILILFQILYEVSLRLPQYLGLATSIVGALILGQTGVSAGLISPPGVVIIAMSIISVYTVADQIAQLTILRALFLIIGGTIGILGIVALTLYFVHELACLNQFGTSYLAPYAPRKQKDLKDGLIKKPVYKMTTRPESIKTKNKTRLIDKGAEK